MKPQDSNKRIKALLKESLPLPDDDATEQRRLNDFRKPKFGSKGMATTLSSLAWHSARWAALAANAGDFAKAEKLLAEAFRRAYWARAVVQKEVPSTLSVILLEAFVRGSGLTTLTALMRDIGAAPDPDRLFQFPRWALRLVEWDGAPSLFDDSPYSDGGTRISDHTLLDEVVRVMCTWHLQVALREPGFSPFMFDPYIALPVEVFAWVKRRERLGLPVPALNHPLLTTPIAKIPLTPVDLAPKGHELIEPLLARCVKENVLTAEQIARMSE